MLGVSSIAGGATDLRGGPTDGGAPAARRSAAEGDVGADGAEGIDGAEGYDCEVSSTLRISALLCSALLRSDESWITEMSNQELRSFLALGETSEDADGD